MFQTISVFVVLAFTLNGFLYNLSSTQTSSDDQTLKLRSDLVLVDVLPVQKKTGRVIADLKRDDFTVFEDNVLQTISHFSQDKLPVSIVLLVDRAGCVNAFSEQIRSATIKAISHLKPEDEIAIMTFSNKVALVQAFTRDRQVVADKIIAVERQHESEQHYFNAGIYEASEYMRRAANQIGRQ